MTHDLCLKKENKLTASHDFKIILQQGAQWIGSGLKIYYMLRVHGSKRIGISISRAKGCAVLRNRLRRILRETFRIYSSFPEVDILVVVTRRIQKDTMDTMRDVFLYALKDIEQLVKHI